MENVSWFAKIYVRPTLTQIPVDCVNWRRGTAFGWEDRDGLTITWSQPLAHVLSGPLFSFLPKQSARQASLCVYTLKPPAALYNLLARFESGRSHWVSIMCVTKCAYLTFFLTLKETMRPLARTDHGFVADM